MIDVGKLPVVPIQDLSHYIQLYGDVFLGKHNLKIIKVDLCIFAHINFIYKVIANTLLLVSGYFFDDLVRQAELFIIFYLTFCLDRRILLQKNENMRFKQLKP